MFALHIASRLRNDADRWVLFGLAAHAAGVCVALSLPPLASVLFLGFLMVWGSNTVSHIHLHTPLFVRSASNRALSLYLTMALGVPQTLWRRRHLAHHARYPERLPPLDRSAWGVVLGELALVALSAVIMALLGVLAPWALGIALGYALCALQGRMEHVAGVRDGWSTYDRWHNRLWFNDGHHAEHHRYPSVHWSQLPQRRLVAARIATRGPLVRALEVRPVVLGWLERLTQIAWIRDAVVRAHVVATQKVLRDVPIRRVLIVGGGLFPRTALVMQVARPMATCTILDADADHLARAAATLAKRGMSIEMRHAFWDGADDGFDLVSLPLALRGARVSGACPRLVHAWIWERSGGRPTAVVAWWLLKRVVLV